MKEAMNTPRPWMQALENETSHSNPVSGQMEFSNVCVDLKRQESAPTSETDTQFSAPKAFISLPGSCP